MKWYFWIPMIGFIIYKVNGYYLNNKSIRKERDFLYYHNIINLILLVISIFIFKSVV